MLEIGTWVGFYQFDSETMLKRNGFERTGFTIEILTIIKDEFAGRVQDDLATGGMNGIGTITGKISGNSITFVKLMPKMLVIHPDGHHEERNKPHQPLYYSGIFAADSKTISGEWHFKTPFLMKMFLSVIGMGSANSGTWTMTVKE